MNAQRFRAFSFVDQITHADSSGLVTGRFLIGSHLEHFPQALVAEAIGQLAAWQSMAQLAFRHRPVAALAGETLYHADALPGDVLTLKVTIDACDSDSVAYSGEARAGERLILQLNHCSGAMLAQEDFDDPALVAEDFQTLRSVGAQPGRLREVPRVLPPPPRPSSDGSFQTELTVPEQADFFLDHFPRKPVFPATLLMHALSWMLVAGAESMEVMAGSDRRARPRLKGLRRVKVRSWIHPGDQVSLKAEGFDPARDSQAVKLSASVNGKLVASAIGDMAPPAAEGPGADGP